MRRVGCTLSVCACPKYSWTWSCSKSLTDLITVTVGDNFHFVPPEGESSEKLHRSLTVQINSAWPLKLLSAFSQFLHAGCHRQACHIAEANKNLTFYKKYLKGGMTVVQPQGRAGAQSRSPTCVMLWCSAPPQGAEEQVWGSHRAWGGTRRQDVCLPLHVACLLLPLGIAQSQESL